MTSSHDTVSSLSKIQVVLLLRWVLIIATSYLVLFSRPFAQAPVGAMLFVAIYFSSNLILARVLPRLQSQYLFDVIVVLLDTAMVSVGVALTGTASSEFFVIYFVVIFLSALSERLGLVVTAAVLIGGAYLYTMAGFVGVGQLVARGYVIRLPFLLVVALFFGHLVSDARGREREAEEAHARERRMEFLSAVSHDLKNPLGVIQSLAAFLLDGDAGPLSEQQTSLIRRIHASTRHVITFALNLIDAASIDAGRLTLHRGPQNLADVVEDALLLGRSAAELKGIALQSSADPDLPILQLDSVQMERVISNLLGNAIKFTPPGGTVRIGVHRSDDVVTFEIRDNGLGIAPEVLPVVFEKYRRQWRAGRTEGSGLGLFIVKAIVEAHGGTVVISSAVGQGTTVTVRLPIDAAARQPSRPAPSPAASVTDIREERMQRQTAKAQAEQPARASSGS